MNFRPAEIQRLTLRLPHRIYKIENSCRSTKANARPYPQGAICYIAIKKAALQKGLVVKKQEVAVFLQQEAIF